MVFRNGGKSYPTSFSLQGLQIPTFLKYLTNNCSDTNGFLCWSHQSFQTLGSKVATICSLLNSWFSSWRNSVFGKLGSWPIELVVERSLASSTMPLSPSNALLRVFEVTKTHSQERLSFYWMPWTHLIRQFHLDCCKRMALVLKTLASGNK